MCRLLGYQGKNPRRLKSEILDVPNAILNQSVCDREACKPNDDGWGYGFEEAGVLKIVKRPTKPAEDAAFKAMAENPYRRVLIHIRRASAGGASIDNTHPWSFGADLVFAHNGSIYGFDRVREDAVNGLPPELGSVLKGETDSEFAMMVFLKHVGGRLQSQSVSVFHEALRRTIAELRRWCEMAGESRLPKLNFMILTRHFLLATRVIHSLGYYVTDDGVLITSERLRDGDDWTALDDSSLIAVGEGGQWETRPL